MIPTLTTPQLVLRPFRPDDAAPLHTIYLQDGVLRYFPNPDPPPLERVERFILAQQKHWDERGYGNWAVARAGQPDEQPGEMIGWAGLWFIAETAETEVGYLLGRDFWGKGYASEAARASLAYGFEKCGLEQVIGLTHPENAASQRVLLKCGLRLTGQREYFGMLMARYSGSRAEVRSASQSLEPVYQVVS